MAISLKDSLICQENKLKPGTENECIGCGLQANAIDFNRSLTNQVLEHNCNAIQNHGHLLLDVEVRLKDKITNQELRGCWIVGYTSLSDAVHSFKFKFVPGEVLMKIPQAVEQGIKPLLDSYKKSEECIIWIFISDYSGDMEDENVLNGEAKELDFARNQKRKSVEEDLGQDLKFSIEHDHEQTQQQIDRISSKEKTHFIHPFILSRNVVIARQKQLFKRSTGKE